MLPVQSQPLDEIQWVDRIRRVLEEELDSDDDHTASISDVPKPLLSAKPEAYVPQLVAFGPYHHHREELHDMERFKLAAAKRLQGRLPDARFEDIVDLFVKVELQIRYHYHRYLRFNGETLAWMLAVDVSFLLEFLRIFVSKYGKILGRASSRMNRLVGLDRRTSAYNSLICDVLMLENQIPLFLLPAALEIQFSSSRIAAEVSSAMLVGFLREVSPFKMLEISPWIDLGQHSHLLELLYNTIAPNSEEWLENVEGDESHLQKSIFCSRLRCFLKAAVEFISNRARELVSAILRFLVTIPWRTIKSIPALAILTHPVEQLFFSQNDEIPQSARGTRTQDKSTTPLLEEIAIPSVTELAKAGIKFSANSGDISKIDFDQATATLQLPSISLDVNAEVVLRNLVAFEASTASRPLMLSRYVELMNGIIDTAADAKLLGDAGVLMNHLKSDEEAAEMWNGMTRSVRMTRVANLDRAIEEMNRFHGSRWSVKMRKAVKKYAAASMECLVVLLAVLFFFFVSMQTWCFLYGCSMMRRHRSN